MQSIYNKKHVQLHYGIHLSKDIGGNPLFRLILVRPMLCKVWMIKNKIKAMAPLEVEATQESKKDQRHETFQLVQDS